MSAKIVGADTFFVPLALLDDDPANPRRTARDEGVEALAASILAHGMLQAVGVVEHPDTEGRYVVKFGGRRLRALRLLAEQKKISKTATVACRPLNAKEAREAALTENVNRVGMHPADMFEAFAQLHDGGKGLSIDRIAQRFGCSSHTVRQRLRLGTLSPVIMDAFRANTLTLDQVMAFTVTDDHAAQDRVLDLLPDYQRNPHTIRYRLTQGDVSGSDRRAVFAGLTTYEAAGGKVKRDLFSDNGSVWLTEPALLDKLVAERLAREATTVRGEGWAWVESGDALPSAFYSLRRVHAEPVPLSDEDAARMQALQERVDAIEQEAAGEDLTDEQAAELARCEDELDTLRDRETAFRSEDVARAGAFVTFDMHGTLTVVRGLLRHDAPEVLAAEQDQEEQDRESGEEGGDEDADAESEAGDPEDAEPEADEPASLPAAAERPEAKELPWTLRAELTAHRTAGLQAEVAQRPHLALCLLIAGLLPYGDHTLRARVQPPSLHADFPGIDATEARQRLGSDEEAQLEGLPEGRALLPWLMEQTTDRLLRMLAPLVARGVDAGHATWKRADLGEGEAQVAAIAGLDMRRWWTPTVDSYFGRVPKALILDAVREGAGDGAARRIEGLKKEPMAEAAAELLAGKGWLPAVLRTPAAMIGAGTTPAGFPEPANEEPDLAAAAD